LRVKHHKSINRSGKLFKVGSDARINLLVYIFQLIKFSASDYRSSLLQKLNDFSIFISDINTCYLYLVTMVSLQYMRKVGNPFFQLIPNVQVQRWCIFIHLLELTVLGPLILLYLQLYREIGNSAIFYVPDLEFQIHDL